MPVGQAAKLGGSICILQGPRYSRRLPCLSRRRVKPVLALEAFRRDGASIIARGRAERGPHSALCVPQ